MLVGIDVSHWQGTVNWGLVAHSGRQFALAKVTDGTDFRDPTFATNCAGIQGVGLVRGAYHFAQPDDSPPEAQADFFLEQINNAGGLAEGDLLALDLETGSGNLERWVSTWLDRVTNSVSQRPLLYSRTSFLDPHGCTGSARLAQCGLWLANYQATMPPTPSSWDFIAIWQHTSGASVPGVNGDCDEDFFNGDLQQLKLYGITANALANPPPVLKPSGPTPTAGDYVVRPGDTLSAIAVAHGCSLADLQIANPQIANPNQIFVGQVVHLPGAGSPPATRSTQTIVVRSGDNLSAIASRFGVSLLALERANPNLSDPNLITPGQVLNIPVSG